MNDMYMHRPLKRQSQQSQNQNRIEQLTSLTVAAGNQHSLDMLGAFAAAGNEVIQRQIQIHGNVYTDYIDIDTASVRRVFGGHPQYLPGLSAAVVNNLDRYLFAPTVYHFISFRNLLAACLPRAGNTLNLAVPGVVYGVPPMNPVPIQMSRFRATDETIANTMAGHLATPANFTWHHLENIRPDGNGNFECDMILVDSTYHNGTYHEGGVHEYEQATGTVYN